ncbi:hypothetical protein CAPTEDRAFT_131203 [Capitella teleta]|uniref:G-protein coupled receptors family 1 profile domain-containing protein n=1 Tax=Capitella teleta TaxID=283909 RepID=R7T8T1_CAPTE|nr:hypothetical protein CAPTEDRAFT_131203 [Capitella teleta]|eukprot:ELT87805.1 hypothetical protein CAPTEDRAFT_131203 [Capitella teleta]
MVLYLLHVYFIPVIIVVGILGNLLSCVVLLGSHMRKQSSSIYLASLSIADTGFLLSLIIVWLAWVDIDLMNRPGWCQITVFVAYVSAFLSVWIVVSFTAERYIAVWHPFRRHVMCSAKRAKIIISSLTVFAVLLYSPSIWTSTVVKRKDKYFCAPKADLRHISNALLNIDIIITLVIPCILITTLRRSTSSTKTALQRRTDSQLKTTRTLVIISSFFVILNAPSHAFRIFGFIQTLRGRTHQTTGASLRGQEAMQLLYYINFAINFFMYSACAKRFRKTIKRMLKRMRYSVVSCSCQCDGCLGDGTDRNEDVHIVRKTQALWRGK